MNKHESEYKDIVIDECLSSIKQRKRYESDFSALKQRIKEVVATLLFHHEEYGHNPDCSVKRICYFIFCDVSKEHKILIKRAFKELWRV